MLLKLLSMAVAALTANACPQPGFECPHAEYAAFREEHHRPAPAVADYGCRCEAFANNTRLINDHNARPDSTYTAALNYMHDMPEPERVAHLRNGYKKRHDVDFGDVVPDVGGSCTVHPMPTTSDDTIYLPPIGASPINRNWWSQGRVTDVRNQGDCGDCWAESATAVVESLYVQKTGQLVQLSVQQVAECTPQFEDEGCNGGWPIDALRYVQRNGGLCNESVYPTTIGNGLDVDCNQTLANSTACKFPFNISRVVGIAKGDEIALGQALVRDVVSVAMDASGRGWGAYSYGVYNGVFNGTADCNPQYLDHAIVATGYGILEPDGVPFYIVRNSWGDTQWGKMQGYILILRGNNTCGIAEDACYIE